jgi:type II restriction enzyme
MCPPLTGSSQTFISIGAFNTEAEAQAALKYVKTKFARIMLGIFKITQHNPSETWIKVPLQDFTTHSDIDWTQSVHDIDLQLYKKYGLDKKEQQFIERKIISMD